MDTKIAELEKMFEGISNEITKIKDDFNESINYVEDVLQHGIDLTWEYAVRNEQYSRKNNLRILGIDEQEGEDLEGKFISCMRENLREEVKPEEVEIIHRVGPKKFTVGNAGNSTGDQRSARPRPVIVRLLSNKTKTRLLLKRRQLKGKKVKHFAQTLTNQEIIRNDFSKFTSLKLHPVLDDMSSEDCVFDLGDLYQNQRHDSDMTKCEYYLEDRFRSKISNYFSDNSPFSVLHFNVRSLTNKLDDLQQYLGE